MRLAQRAHDALDDALHGGDGATDPLVLPVDLDLEAVGIDVSEAAAVPADTYELAAAVGRGHLDTSICEAA